MSHISSIKKTVAISGIALAGVLGLSACNNGGGSFNPSNPAGTSQMSLDQIKQEALKLVENSSTPADRSAYGSEVACMASHSKEVSSVAGQMKPLEAMKLAAQVGDYIASNTPTDQLPALVARTTPQGEHEVQVVTDAINQAVDAVAEGNYNGLMDAQCVAAKQIRAALS